MNASPKPCALCSNITSPKNGRTDTSDANLCAVCLASYEKSSERVRARFYTQTNNPSAAAVALTDFIYRESKELAVRREREAQEKSRAAKTQ